MNLNNLTVSQLLLAAGRARGMKPPTLARVIDCSEAYYYKLLHKPEFVALIEQFKGSDLDPDNVKYVNIGTLLMDVGKFLYHAGQKIKLGESDE